MTAVRLAAVCASLVGLGAFAPAASGDSLVYVKEGYVYVANADGSQARPVTPQSDSWAWPSESDNGKIAVAGGAEGTNGTIETSGSSNVYLFDQQGRSLLSSPVQTPGASRAQPRPPTSTTSAFRPTATQSRTTTSITSVPHPAWRRLRAP